MKTYLTFSIIFLFCLSLPTQLLAKDKKACPDLSSIDLEKKLSIDLQDTKIENAFRILAEVSSYNIIGINTPKSKVTLKLTEKTVKEVIDALTEQQKLHYNIKGNVITFFKNTDPARFKISKHKKYEGKCISLDFNKTEISSAKKIIEGISGKTILNLDAEALNKKITMKTINLPWQQALDIILLHDGKQAVYSGGNILAE